jgi:hypothetical protein
VYIVKQHPITKGADVKRNLVIVLTALLAAGVCTPSFAAKSGPKAAGKKFDRIVAEVVSVDPAAKTMVVKREENGESRTVTISDKAAAQLHTGDRVRIKLKAGTNESAGVRILGAKPGVDTAAVEPGAKTEPNVEAKTEAK